MLPNHGACNKKKGEGKGCDGESAFSGFDTSPPGGKCEQTCCQKKDGDKQADCLIGVK